MSNFPHIKVLYKNRSEAAAEAECGDFTPLRNLGLAVESVAQAEEIASAADCRLSEEEKAQCYWQASRDLHKRLSAAEKNDEPK
jgi:hypothetical protein